MNQGNTKNFGQETVQRTNYFCGNNQGRKNEGAICRSIFTRPEQSQKTIPQKAVQEMKKDATESKLSAIEDKIEDMLVKLDNASGSQEILSSSSGETVKLRERQSQETLPEKRTTDLALEGLIELRDSLNSRVDKMMRESEMIMEDFKSLDIPSDASNTPRSHKLSSRTHNIEDAEENLRKCKDILNRLIDQEIENVARSKAHHHRGAGDENMRKFFSGDPSPFRTGNVAQSESYWNIKIQRKSLIESIYVLSQRLNQLECYEKL